MSAPLHPSVRLALAHLGILCTLTLCSCAKKQWHYVPPSAPAPSKDFDAHFDATQLDPNGAPRNIDWQPQLQGHIPNPDECNSGQPYSSACTQNKPFQDQPDGLHEAFCFIGKVASGSPYQSFFGHADWMVSQFNGTVGWFNFGDDWDYDLFLIPASDHLPPTPPPLFNAHGITTNNNHVSDDKSPQYIEMEFDSTETDSAFTKGWWSDFKTSGHDDDAGAIAHLMHPESSNLACGTAVGLFGLDCDHGCRSELHPIYGLAIQRKEEADDNEWSVMARNWGTGGYCSQYNDELAEGNLSLILPYNSSQQPSSVTVKDFISAANTANAQFACPTMYFQNGQAIVNLTLPPPEQRPVVSFSLILQWPAGSEPVACTQPSKTAPAMMSLSPEHPVKPGPMQGEEYMGSLLRAASQSRSQNIHHLALEKDILPVEPQVQARMQQLKQMIEVAPSTSCDGTLTIKPGLPKPAPLKTARKLLKDAPKQVRDDAIRSYICHTYQIKSFALPAGTTQQDVEQACKGVK